MSSRFIKILMAVCVIGVSRDPGRAQVVIPVDAGGPIADNATNNFTFSVNQSFTVRGVALRFSAAHDNIPDLEASLKSPTGTTVLLFTEVGFGTSPDALGKRAGYFQNVLFTDSAPARIDNFVPAKLTGEYQVQFGPDNLGVFNGENSSGTWELLVKDLFPDDAGYLYQSGDNNTDLILMSLNLTQPMLSVPSIASGNLEFSVSGETGAVYRIQSTTDLTSPNWADLGLITNTAGSAQFADTNGAQLSSRFYRAVLTP